MIAPVDHVGDTSGLLALAWLGSGLCSHLGSEAANGSVSVPLCFSIKYMHVCRYTNKL